MNGLYQPGDIVFNSWILEKKIGEGSYGQVFQATRSEFGEVYKAAIKIITIPQSESEIKSARAEGMDDQSITTYFRSFVEEIVQEFALMAKLKGNSHVVSYEDHMVLEHRNHVGWDILIRMELLTPLLDYIQQHPLTRLDVIKLGIDITKALELCQKYNIVHRDIKPENIFVSPNGDFKLGDFGIARTVEKTTGGLSKKGTYTYMAPEVYKDEPYGSNVDLYSLGLVMYRLLNENRTPFLPAYPAPITHSDRENALAQRISGAMIPPPKSADGRLAEIVLKACAYQPRDRYSSPMQMRTELEAIQYSRAEANVIYPKGDEAPIRSVHNIPTGGTSSPYDSTSSFDRTQGTTFDRTQSVFNQAPPPSNQTPSGPAFVPNQKTSPQQPAPQQAKQPKQKKSGNIFGRILVGAVAFFVFYYLARGLNSPKPSTSSSSSQATTHTYSIPEISMPNFADNLKSPGSIVVSDPIPDDLELIASDIMLVGTTITPGLVSETTSLAGATIYVNSLNTDVLQWDSENNCVRAVAPGTGEIEVTYEGLHLFKTIKVLNVSPDSTSSLEAELYATDGDTYTYALTGYNLPNELVSVQAYASVNGTASVNCELTFGEQMDDGRSTFNIYLPSGRADVTFYIAPFEEPEDILASCNVQVNGKS